MIDLFSNSKELGWIWPVTAALLATILLAGGTAFAQVPQADSADVCRPFCCRARRCQILRPRF